MSAYIIVNYRITDPEGIAIYREKVLPQLLQANCEILVVNDDVDIIEGSIAPTLIILKFESKEAAMAFFSAPEYQAIVHHRLNSTTDTWVAASEEFQLPG